MTTDGKSAIFKYTKNYVNELQMRKYFLGIFIRPKAILLAKKIEIHQK